MLVETYQIYKTIFHFENWYFLIKGFKIYRHKWNENQIEYRLTKKGIKAEL